ncbi:hypothetical protein dsmv_0593 [Desulfococcus multivorans DSM 2059]|uniref:Uncharacterized protein n=1 Tax=Desulfococcus multivorans DSM 2059 TaxID=1121405 RepID=S7UU68_DESML|nr:hypothetical protein dsmv_0593 [Desulfococcus multivorans DSM 2059]
MTTAYLHQHGHVDPVRNLPEDRPEGGLTRVIHIR